MKIKFQYCTLLLLVTLFSFAQIKKENMGTEEVNVVKSYKPTIQDASKIKEIPTIDETETAQKEVVKYNIFSFPVASTFAPAKGKAANVEKTKQDYLYKNYVTLGYGNYQTLNGDLYVTKNISDTDYVGGIFSHHSSQGGIKNLDLDDAFFDTSIGVNYGTNQHDFNWKTDLVYQNQIYNWYGLPTDFGSSLSVFDRDNLISKINPQHSYNGFALGSKIEFNESIFSQVNLTFNHFSDSFKSSENRFYIKPTFQVDISDTTIKTNVIVDYVGGSFEKNYTNTNIEVLKYGYTNIGISPSFVMLKDDWTLNVGASLFYSLDTQRSKSKLFIYPNFTASLKVVGDFMIFYTGAEGNLEQNSYSQFVAQNPFLSPTLAIAPTSKSYDIFAGLKGKLASFVNYNLKASYTNEHDKALFKSNDYSETATNPVYGFGNSMQVVYDDIKTLRFYGELKADFSENVRFGIDATLNSYTATFEPEAWNLPTLKINSSLDFTFDQKWNIGFNVFLVGKRKDLKINTSIISTPTPTTLDSYFDANAHINYKYSDRLSFYLKANNIGNQNYQKWLNFPVQGLQIVAGAGYKFDF